MQQLTPEGRHAIEDIAQRQGFSVDAVLSMLQAVMNGNGSMAQFNHPEFGGSGQWMHGGMTMVGDMFNNMLKARVDALCCELAGLLASRPLFSPSPTDPGGPSVFVTGTGHWWPQELGTPSSSGSQNEVRYAVFPATRRLAIEIQGRVTVYDTLDHQIGGVSQQQGGASSLIFSSQYGQVQVSELPVVSGGSAPVAAEGSPGHEVSLPPMAEERGEGDIFEQIEKLAELHHRGVLSDQEFAAKKTELLQRI